MVAEAQSSHRSTLAEMIELASADKRDWDATIQKVLRVEARAFQVARVSFWELHGAGGGEVFACEMTYLADIGAFERGPVASMPAPAEYIGAVTHEAPLAIEDVSADRRLDPVRPYLDAHGITSELDCPVWCEGKVAGILSLEHVGGPRRWTVYDEYLAVTVAQSVSAALEVRARTRVQQCSRRMIFLAKASRELGGTLDVDEVARRATALIVPTVADGVRLALCEEGRPPWIAALEYRTPEGRAALEAATRNPRARIGYMGGLAIDNRNSILVPDVTRDKFVEAERRSCYPDLPRTLEAIGVQSLLTVPLLSGDTSVGVLQLYGSTRRFGLDDLEVAEEFAKHLSGAIANAQLHRRLEAALQAREEFIALAGHELRTPITALELSARQLLLRSRDEALLRPAERVAQLVRRLERLTSRMLDAAQISSGVPFVCRRAPTDLVVVARETADVHAPLAERSRCTIELRGDPSAVGQWDAQLLDTMLSCLLDNALKFGAGQPVEITVRSEDGTATVAVSDRGPGIPADRVASVFEPFERAAPARHYGGLGLGLFIARAIAEAHGGELAIDNRPGEGVTFTARLPRSA